jgi:hypothetical protein
MRITGSLRRLCPAGGVARRLLRIDHRLKEGPRRGKAPIAQLLERQSEPPRLNHGQPQRQALAVRRRIKLPASAIQRPGSDLDEVLVDEFPQHAVEALLGDPQYLQKLGDRQPRPPADKIENAMMSASKSVSLEQPIGVADKIAIGEKEQLDQFVHRLFRAARLRRRTWLGDLGRRR